MSKIIKSISNLEIINQINWYEEQKDHLNDLSIQARWNLKKNIKKIEERAKSFYDFRDSLVNELNNKYFQNDEKSQEIQLDEQNTTRQIKEEYQGQYNNDVQTINIKIDDILNETEQIEFDSIDLDKEIENMKPDAQLSDKCMEMLSFYFDE